MIIRDPLSGWDQPAGISKWGEKLHPPSDRSWIDFINYCVHPDIATIVARLLIPEFIVFDGGVFNKLNFDVDTYTKWAKILPNISEVERMINHQHVYDLFNIDENIDENSYATIAYIISKTIKMSLKCAFPDRQFCVYLRDNGVDYGPTVGFYSERTFA